MTKAILAIGCNIGVDAVSDEEFNSRASLLDWDIIVFRPVIDSLEHATKSFRGKPCLSEDHSFSVKEACEHWRRELKQALDSGKTIFIFLPELTEFHVATGESQYSGSGRNRSTTRIVSIYNNYRMLPIDLKPVASTGSSLKVTQEFSSLLAGYWSEFESFSCYNVIITNDTVRPSITTKSGNKSAGSVIRSKQSSGCIIFLPDLDFEGDGFFEKEGESFVWSTRGKEFGAKLIGSIVGIDKALRATAEFTPEPFWATHPQYVLVVEKDLRTDLLNAESQLEIAQRHKEMLYERLSESGTLRHLLYEKGKPLELARLIQRVEALAATWWLNAVSHRVFFIADRNISGGRLGLA